MTQANMTPRVGNSAVSATANWLAWQAILVDLDSSLLERHDVARGILLGLLARCNTFLIGPPGTAKSLTVTETAKRISGATCFSTLMTRFSTPEEIFGALDLAELEQGRAVRNTAGMLPTADLAFLDEVFKANSAILNALLKILNEREYRNGPNTLRVPLLSCVGASNELPQGEDLGALYDRFLLRYHVGPLADDSAFGALLTLGRPGAPVQTLTLAEVHAAQAQVDAVAVPASVVADICRMRAALQADGITASDRRWRDSVAVLRASAWLDGRSAVSTDDLTVYTDILWSDPSERSKVASKVLAFAAPTLRRALELLDQAAEQRRIVLGSDETARMEAAAKLRKIGDEMQKVAAGSKNARIVDAAAKVAQYRKDAMNAVLGS